MLSRALSLATVTLLMGWFAAAPVRAQAQNLEAGKSPSQIFAGTCNACHKGPRGLLRTVPAGSLPGFLRQHYTTSSEMASLLSAFLISNGASDTRVGRPGQAERRMRNRKPRLPACPTISTGSAAGFVPGRRRRRPSLTRMGRSRNPPGRKRLARPGEPAEVRKTGWSGAGPGSAGTRPGWPQNRWQTEAAEQAGQAR